MKISISAFPINSWFGIVGAFLGWFLGGLDDLLYVLLIFMAVDYLTGVLCAISERKLSSEIGFKGIMRKVLILVLVGIAHALGLPVPEKLKEVLKQLHGKNDDHNDQ